MALLVWSGVILYFHAKGRMPAYLAPDFRTIAMIGGLGLAVVGLFNLFTAGQTADCGHDHDGDDHDHESGDMHPLVAFLLMVLPVLLSVSWTKDAYSVKALSRKGLYDATAATTSPFLAEAIGPITRETMEESHRRTATGFYQFSLMELFFSSGDRELQAAIDGMKVETEGRWAVEKVRNENETRSRLYRLFMTCCIADSRAIPIVLEFGKTPPGFNEGDWTKVTGTMTFPVEDGMIQPVLEVEYAELAEPPFEESFIRN